MREILFKAKVKNWKQLPKEEWWVEGYYGIKGKGTELEEHFIICSTFSPILSTYPFYFTDIQIDPETLCQYTGLTDKNGNKIWENDILRGYQYPYRSDGNDNYFAEVTWFENCPAFGIYTFKNPKSNVCGISEGNTEFMENWNSEDWEVIGNIFDNAELLEV